MHLEGAVGLHDEDSSAKSPNALPQAVPTTSLTPDRRRIDSDVRCFLRQPSTPWITFDKAPGHDGAYGAATASREPSVFTSASSSILTTRVFPPDPPWAPEPPKQEPSSLAVAADLGIGPVAAYDAQHDPFADADAERFLPAKRSSRVVVGAAAAIALVGLASVIAFGVKSTDEASRSHRAPHSAYASQPNGADITPPSLDIPEAKPAATASPSTPATALTSATTTSTGPDQYGRLSIAGKARASYVFLDGKRLLGRGARSFTIVCGPHQIAVGDRSNVRAVDVPCNAETVISE